MSENCENNIRINTAFVYFKNNNIQYNMRIPESDKIGILSASDATLGPEFFLLISIEKYTLKTRIWEFWIPDKISGPCIHNFTLIDTRKTDIVRFASPLVDNQLIVLTQLTIEVFNDPWVLTLFTCTGHVYWLFDLRFDWYLFLLLLLKTIKTLIVLLCWWKIKSALILVIEWLL